MQTLVQVYRYSQDHTFTRQLYLHVNTYNYTRDHTLIYRYVPGCTYSGANTFTHKPQSNTITAAHENNKKLHSVPHLKPETVTS